MRPTTPNLNSNFDKKGKKGACSNVGARHCVPMSLDPRPSTCWIFFLFGNQIFIICINGSPTSAIF
jgi:hypothetical protein